VQRIYCKDFAVALKKLDVFNKKEMYDSVITEIKICMFYMCMFYDCYLAFLGLGLAFLAKTGWLPWSALRIL